MIGSSRNIKEDTADKQVERVYSAHPVEGNAKNEIPFTDPDNNDEPIYPFVLWADDLLLALYWLGDEDALTINRTINLSMTDVNWGMRFHAHPAGYWKKTGDGTGTPPADVTISPGDMIDPGDHEPAYLSPEFTPDPVIAVLNFILRSEAMLDGNSAVAQITEASAPESGYALTIRNLPLAEHRQRMIEIYRPFVEETLRRAIIVWNTYAEENDLPLIIGKPVWNPGKMETPKDPEAEARLWALKISKNVATPVHWRMAETGEDHDTAKAAVEANAKANKELIQQGIAGEMFGARFGAAAQDDIASRLTVPDGFTIEVFADGLGRARFMELGPGDAVYLSLPREGRIVSLHRKDGRVVAVNDDIMSATRYAMMMLRKARVNLPPATRTSQHTRPIVSSAV